MSAPPCPPPRIGSKSAASAEGILSHVAPVRIDVWLLDTRALGEDDVAAAEAILSPSELKRAHRFFFPHSRRDFAAAHALARLALATPLDCAAQAIEFEIEPLGRPFVTAPPPPGVPDFNLSHTRGYVAVGIGSGPRIGVDIEFADRIGKPERLFRYALAPVEIDRIRKLDTPSRQRRFIQLWTLKEAYLKVLGTGLQTEPSSFSIDVDQKPMRLAHGAADPGGWFFDTRFHESGLCLSVCCAAPHADVVLHDGSALFVKAG
jgi:4'-phosphopantetheinyl transferase